MPGRSDERDRVCGIAVEDLIDGDRRRSRCEPGNVKGLRADCSIHIHKRNTVFTEASNLLDEPEAMTPHDVFIGDLPWRQMLELSPQRLVLLEGGNDNPEPLRVLRMVSGFVLEESGIVDQGRRHGGTL